MRTGTTSNGTYLQSDNIVGKVTLACLGLFNGGDVLIHYNVNYRLQILQRCCFRMCKLRPPCVNTLMRITSRANMQEFTKCIHTSPKP